MYSGVGRAEDVPWQEELATHLREFSLCGFGITAASIDLLLIVAVAGRRWRAQPADASTYALLSALGLIGFVFTVREIAAILQ